MELTIDIIKDLENRFGFHPNVTEIDAEAHAAVREVLKTASSGVLSLIPMGSEAGQVLRLLDEAAMYASAALARVRPLESAPTSTTTAADPPAEAWAPASSDAASAAPVAESAAPAPAGTGVAPGS